MTPAGEEPSSSHAGLPWAFVLDPAANAAAMTEVQRQGLDAARRLVGRAIARSDQSTRRGPAGPEGRRRTTEGPPPRELVGEVIRCWTELTTQVLAKLAEDGEDPRPAESESERDERAAVPIDGSGLHDRIRIRLEGGAKGGLHAASEFWLSNPSDRSVGPVDLRVDDLHTPDGHKLASSSVRFDPPVIEELAPGSTRMVGLTASIVRRLAPGTYRGIIQSEGAPAFVLGLEVELLPSVP